MDDATRLAAAQLSRMRGMTVEYHRRFFGDIRFAIVTMGGLFVLGFWTVPAAFLLVPVVALYSAVQTAFDASYLIFARQYAARLERYLNERTGETIHVGAAMEEAYLFPLDVRKIVTAAGGRGFTWFGFVTLFYTALGLAAAGFGLALGYTQFLHFESGSWTGAYLAVLVVLAVLALGVGAWWFVSGEGEGRLREALDQFPAENGSPAGGAGRTGDTVPGAPGLGRGDGDR